MFKCDACRGSGRFIRGFHNPRDYGPCNKCKGTGKLKTSPEDRAKRKDAEAKRKQARIDEYGKQHAAELQWVAYNMGRGFQFARSMMEALIKYESWTDGQLAAIRRCIAQDEQRAQEKAKIEAAAPP